MLVCGVDEAGRGPVIGPLVIAGVSIERRHLRRLVRAGVRDSKKLSPERRAELYPEIIEMAEDHAILKVMPATIDNGVRRHALNHIEASRMARVISKLLPDTAYVDACDVNAARFGARISDMLSDACSAKVVSRHRADSRFAVVAAASILAKVTRDRAISRIRKNHDIGSGYPSDPVCVRFLEKHSKRNRTPPDFARMTWATIHRIYGIPSPSSRRRVRDRGRMVRGQTTLRC